MQSERSKSAVWALLGIPTERGNRPVPALTVPPSGFRHGQSPLPPLQEAEEEPGQDEGPSAPTNGVVPDAADNPPHSVRGQRAGPTRGLSQVHHGAAVLAPGQGNVASTPTEHDARPGTRAERTNLAIPGVSRTRQDFPALSGTRGVPADPTAAAWQEDAAEPTRQSGHTSSRPHTPRTATVDGELLTGLERLIADAEANRKREAQTAREPARAAQRPAPTTDNAEARPLPSSRPSAGPFVQASVNGTDRANTDLAQRLEQLRRTVGELAAKVAAQPARNHDESQHYQQTTPQPPQRVVVIKRPAQPSRVPRAFWERSHLNRLHLRTIR